MLGSTEQIAMAKSKGRPKKPGGEGTQVRIDSHVARMAKFVASESAMSLSDYLSGLLRDRVTKDYRRCAKAIGDEAGEASSGG